jgi:2-aminoadipate transaminase
MNTRFAGRMARVQPSAIRQLLQLGADPTVTSFAGGYPDASLFPMEHLKQAFLGAIDTLGGESLQYTVSNGSRRLREQIAGRMVDDGVACGADDVLVLQGSQQGLDLVAKLLVDEGDIIVTERPTFIGALIAFNPCQPRYVGIPMDQDGMDMLALEQALKRHKRVRFVYTIPDFQNPTGVTMSLARRQRLIELASEFDFLILEDTPYRPLRFLGESIPTLKSMDREGRVILLGTFSKILAPGLRLGWVVASEEIIEKLGLLKLAADTQCGTLTMAAVSMYLDSQDVEPHVQAIRSTYRRKKDVMLQAIRESFPRSVSFTNPNGGMFTWLSFPSGFDSARFMAEQALPKARVAYVPGAGFFPDEEEANHARLSFPAHSDEVITKGITTLGRLLQAELAQG